MMKLPLLATVFVATIFSAQMSFSDTYQTEIKMNYMKYDFKNGEINNSLKNFEVSRYLSPISAASVPFAEAAFLNKTSSFTVGYIEAENDVPYGAIDNKGRWAEVNYYVPDTLFFFRWWHSPI